MESTDFIEQLIQGNESAWGEFYERATGEIHAALKSEYGGLSVQDIEDITQDVFLALLENDRAVLRSFIPNATLDTLIKTIARNAANNLMGSAERRREVASGGAAELEAITEWAGATQ